jgi:hypothetical protein
VALLAGGMKFTIRNPTSVVENSGVKKSTTSALSKKEAIWNENALFYKLFCTRKGFVIKVLTCISKLEMNVQNTIK